MEGEQFVDCSERLEFAEFSHKKRRLILTWGEQVQSGQSLSHVRLCDPMNYSTYITNSWSLLKLMSMELVMPSNHLILCRPLLFPPSIFPSIRVFSKESVLCIRWPKY